MVLEFLRNYWKEILEILAIVVSIVICCIRKRSIKDIFSFIAKDCLLAVSEAEKTNFKGDEKLNFAVELVNKFLLSRFPDINVTSYRSVIVKTIEDILSTPQKKEVC